ncbi:MAG TPA: molybdopterin dinucleotide-binding protein [Coriobacteriia bacterium]|nr:MAG: putative anaerobic dehydrogenase [Actinobacteria bacterium 66_15]HAL30207.1 molybdopterin dinucleotide-binding protein [Coriobacteriia bacterium]
MTNHWVDLKNSDVVMVNGSNAAENHPISMKWVQEAKNAGGKLIVVDPRFSRSAAVADLYAPIRTGTDIAFYGGFFNYIMENGLYHEEYVKNYTNASYIVKDSYSFEDGLFSGYDDSKRKYDATAWAYEVDEEAPWDTSETGAYSWVNKPGTPAFAPPVYKKAKTDPTLQDPRCVWQLMKKHFSRYTPELVSSITGMPQDVMLQVWDLYGSTGQPGKAGTIMYAMGQTQHTYGSQNVRSMAIMQLLLGNMGICGGGVNALRGESNVQGSTDMAMLFHIIPGYNPTPKAADHPTLAAYFEKTTVPNGYWTNRPKFIVSYLKELYGDYATLENDYAYDMMPKLDGTNHSHIAMFEHMEAGKMEGLFLWGQNPAVGGPNCSQERRAMEKLKWMVSIDLWETETAIFWSDKANVDPTTIDTEVFMLPAACHYEKSGEVANSGRWIQWRYKAVEPPGEAKDDLEIATEIYLKIKDLYEAEGGANPEQITKLNWDYLDADGHADVRKVARAINGYTVADNTLVANFTKLGADGTTACGNWIYSGYYNKEESWEDPSTQPTGARDNTDNPGDGLEKPIGSYLGWSFAWPVNRRIIYNRASADPSGKPYNEDKVIVAWDGEKWLRNDVPDFGWNKVLPDGTNQAIPPNTTAFMMNAEGVSRFFASGNADGPFPEHYEPFESPVENQMSSTQFNPAAVVVESAAKTRGTYEDFPIVMTTFRLTEHWQTGGLTRNLPWLVETMPKMFVEISKELAEEKGIVSGDNVVIQNNRGAITAFAMVTNRIKSLDVAGKKIHQIAAPWHWGYGSTCSVGGMANDLTPNVGDANTWIPEYKSFLVDIRKQEV